MPDGVPEILAHRAGPVRHGVPRHAEQTLPAFRETWAGQRVTCELDVRLTGDGVPVAFHDATLRRVTGRPGRLEELDLPAFRALRADLLGADRHLARTERPVPLATLDDVLRFARASRARLNVELKNLPGEPAFDPSGRTAELVAARLRASGIPASRLTVQSFWAGDVTVLSALLPGVRRSLLAPAGQGERGVELAVAAGTDAVGLAWPTPPEVVREARDRGLAVMAYTVNEADGVRDAARARVDAIITDDPAMARRALAAAAAPPAATRTT
jgi:glycerophosphoryl diester phosphodiesterase